MFWDLDGTPLYVGLSRTKHRIKKHLSGGTNPILANKIKALKIAGLSIDHEKVAEGLTRSEACEIEISLIAHYGRRDLGTGPLYNLTAGGDGLIALSAETRKAIGEANKIALLGNHNSLAYSKSEAGRQARRNSAMGNSHAKGKKNALGSRHSPEWKENKRIFMLGRQYAVAYFRSAEGRENSRRVNLNNTNAAGHSVSPSAIKAISEKNRAKWADPKWKALTLERRRLAREARSK